MGGYVELVDIGFKHTKGEVWEIGVFVAALWVQEGVEYGCC